MLTSHMAIESALRVSCLSERVIRRRDIRMSRTQLATVALIYGTYVWIATFYPFELSRDPSHSLANALAHFFPRVGLTDFVLNVLLFLPFGALFYRLWTASRSKKFIILLITVAGTLASLCIELLQVCFTRQPSGFDVLANTLGAAAGAVLALTCPARFCRLAYRCWRKVEQHGVILLLALLLGTVPIVISVVQLIAPFGIWDSHFTFQLANEATYNRPWLGKIHFVALYSRALPTGEVARHFHRGPSALKMPSTDDVVALYAFNEGSGNIIRDISGFGPALDLSFSPKGRVRWLDSENGIEIVQPSIVRSSRSPRKLYDALQDTHELSIEVWITPDNTVQGGPARILSFSRDTGARNFTLGQQGAEIEFRVRTPVSGMNGTPLALESGNEIAAGKQTHIVATYQNGMEKLYINGKQQAKTLNLPSDGIIGFGTRRTLISRIAYSFLYFFPASLFLSLFISMRANHIPKNLFLSVAIATGLVLLSESFQALMFKRPIDLSLLICGVIIAVFGAMSGQILLGTQRIKRVSKFESMGHPNFSSDNSQ
jgi:VanZ family protein